MITQDHTPLVAAEESALLPVYRPSGPVFVGGEASSLIAEDGARYLDFTSGIGVNALGYGNATLTEAIRESLDSGLIHTSNLFSTGPSEALARWLVDHSFADRAFFCNSGAEANEAAFKFARRWSHARGSSEKHEIVAFSGGFHGRTFGALAATDRPELQEPFRPLPPGIRIVDMDLASVDGVVDRARTAAVIVEPIQGEGGIVPIPPAFLKQLRHICDSADALLIFDEVQVGLGRTGSLWAYESTGVEPDLLTLAKPLAGGLPMGAVLLAGHVAEAIQPGDHATTFGGGPLVASAALAVCRTIGTPSFLADVRRKGGLLDNLLTGMALSHPEIIAIRGAGLIRGIELRGEARPVVANALEKGLLLCGAGRSVVRLLPPLTISDADLARGVALLESAL